ncbi:MAG: TlpA family protein disulfide reductase [Chitinophagales bacterium]|nr:TlpA family protein disulfide reductase [Chitinophagales bacterium]
MVKYFLVISLFFSSEIFSQNFKKVPFDELEQFLASDNDTLYIVNFWATWCKPCLEEMPYFEQIGLEKKNEKVKVILVSVDTESRWEASLSPFITKRNVQSEVWSLYNKKPGDWIDRISPQWSGAIPGTLFMINGKKYFYEKEFTYEELIATIQSINQ